MNYLKLSLAVFSLSLSGADPLASGMANAPHPYLPVLGDAGLYQLRDAVYYFPANFSPEDPTVYLPLRRWDLIFTGDHRNTGANEYEDENINYLIPGPFNHLMVYMGKDARGLAYAVELNTGSFHDLGGIALICLGSDYGILRHPDHQNKQNRRIMTSRWALRFEPESLSAIHESEAALLARIHSDLILGFPYQLEFSHSGSIYDPYVYLVDDGFEGGAGCSDYWTTLFEIYAGVCIKYARLSIEEFTAYFKTDPEGRKAYAPADMSPFGKKMYIWQILNAGFKAVYDEPHVFSCDGSTERGLVLPSLIMESELLEEIPYRTLPRNPPWFLLKVN